MGTKKKGKKTLSSGPHGSYRWLVLACFGAAAGLTQLLWLNFAPILSLVEQRFGIGESQASLLLLVFPVIYVLLSVHAGAMTDRRGYRTTLVFGTLLMALFSFVRVYLGNFWVLFAAQVGIAIAQPYVVNAISKLVLDWFDREQEALATGLGTMGMFIGMALGLSATPPLVARFGMETAMFVFALLSLTIFLVCFVWVRPNPTRVSAVPAVAGAGQFAKDFRKLIRNPELVLVFALSFLGLGYFNGITTWLEPILAPNGFDSVKAGVVGGVLILGGIVGSAVIPAVADLIKKRRIALIACITIACSTIYPFASTTHYSWVIGLAFAQGFFFLPAFAILLEICADLAGPKQAGSATGILMLAGNLGGVIVIVAMEMAKGDSPTFERAIGSLIALMAVAIVGAVKLWRSDRVRG